MKILDNSNTNLRSYLKKLFKKLKKNRGKLADVLYNLPSRFLSLPYLLYKVKLLNKEQKQPSQVSPICKYLNVNTSL